MSRTRIVAALVCVGVLSALAGPPAFSAAKKLVTSKQIKNRTIKTKDISKKAREALRGQVGPAGPRGLPGAPGEPGAPGDPASGADRQFALLFPNLDATCASGFPSGVSDSVGCESIAPAYAGSEGLEIRDLQVTISNASEEEITVLLHSRDGEGDPGEAAGCVIDPGGRSCEGAGASFAPGSIFGLQAVSVDPLPGISLSYDTYRPDAAPPLVGGPFEPGPFALKRMRGLRFSR